MKTSFNYFASVIVVLFFTGCSSLSQEEVTIIDQIMLGSKVSTFDSLELGLSTFYTNNFWRGDYIKEQKNGINLWTSNVLNFDNYNFKNGQVDISHYGIIYPTMQNDKIRAVDVILVSSNNTTYSQEWFNPLSIQSTVTGMSFPVKTISSTVRQDIVDVVVTKYTAKYGEPREYTTDYHTLYTFKDGQIFTNSGIEDENSELIQTTVLRWETKAYVIELCLGFRSGAYFNTEEDGYVFTIGSYEPKYNYDSPFDKTKDNCVLSSFIRYRLKQQYVKNLGLDKMDGI